MSMSFGGQKMCFEIINEQFAETILVNTMKFLLVTVQLVFKKCTMNFQTFKPCAMSNQNVIPKTKFPRQICSFLSWGTLKSTRMKTRFPDTSTESILQWSLEGQGVGVVSRRNFGHARVVKQNFRCQELEDTTMNRKCHQWTQWTIRKNHLQTKNGMRKCDSQLENGWFDSNSKTLV